MSRYLLVGCTGWVKQRGSHLVATYFSLMKALPKLGFFLRAEHRQARHKIAEFLHRFLVLVSQILFHTANTLQFTGRY